MSFCLLCALVRMRTGNAFILCMPKATTPEYWLARQPPPRHGRARWPRPPLPRPAHHRFASQVCLRCSGVPLQRRWNPPFPPLVPSVCPSIPANCAPGVCSTAPMYPLPAPCARVPAMPLPRPPAVMPHPPWYPISQPLVVTLGAISLSLSPVQHVHPCCPRPVPRTHALEGTRARLYPRPVCMY